MAVAISGQVGRKIAMMQSVLLRYGLSRYRMGRVEDAIPLRNWLIGS